MQVKQKKKRNKGFCIFAFGAKKMQGISKRSIESALVKMVSDADEDLCYVITGSVRETEKAVYFVCRKRHFPVTTIPADFEKFSVNAEHLRNGAVLAYFKPSKILIAHTEPEEESVVKALLSWAKKNGSEVTVIPKKAAVTARTHARDLESFAVRNRIVQNSKRGLGLS